jgi:streptogramin lyase
VPTIVASPTLLNTSIYGDQASFSVMLNCQPGNNPVVVSLASLEPSQGSLSQTSLVFTSANWSVAQTVVVIGLNDGLNNGDQTYQITGSAQGGNGGSGTNYNGVTMTPVTVINHETDLPGINVTPDSVTTTQTGGTGSFSIVLTSQPTANVTVTLVNPEPNLGSLSRTTVTFTPSNWNTPQTVTVTGLNDHVAAGNQSYQITGSAASADGNYNRMVMTPVTVVNLAPGINVAGSTFLVAVDNQVLRVDAATGAVVASYSTGVANDGITVGPDGSLYVADYNGKQILHYDATGTFLSSFGTTGTPQGLAWGPDGNLYVTTTNSSVERYSPTGSFLGVFIAAGSGGLSNAKAIVWGPDGNAYVSSYSSSEVLRYNGATGTFMNVFAAGSGGFEDITFGPDKNLYVASYGDGAVYRYNGATGASLGTFVSGIATAYGLRFDAAGNLDVSVRSAGQIMTYDGTTGAPIGSLATGLTNPAYMVAPTSLVTSETGTTANFSLVLNNQPTADVTVTLSSTMPGQGTLSQPVVTFTPANWNAAQTVTVTGLDDHLLNGDQTYQINGTAASADASYNGLTMAPVIIVNREADVAGLTVTPTAIQTSMTGGTASFAVALTSIPAGQVTVALASTNAAEGTLSQTSLTFNAADWNVAQTVTVTGQNDPSATGDVTYQITGSAASGDANYRGLTMTPVTVTNVFPTAGFVVTPTSLTTSELGTSASFSLVLTTQPAYSVTVNLTNGNPAQGALSVNSLTFTPLTWNKAQYVTVTGLDDGVVNGNQTYQITGSAVSQDPAYTGLTMTPVTVVNQEADVATVTTVVSSGNQSVYGQPVTFTATVGALGPGTPTGMVTFWDGSTTLATVSLSGDTAQFTTSTLPAGSHSITGEYDGVSFFVASTSGPLSETVVPATLTVTADDATKVYGQANPAFSDTITGFVNGDTMAVVSGQAVLGTAATAGSGVGSYAITASPGTLSAANYSFAFADGTLTVTSAPLTVTASDTSKVYGQPNPAFIVSYSGLVNGDTPASLASTLTFSTPATAASAAGTYAITPGGLASPNYAINFVKGTLAVLGSDTGGPVPPPPPVQGQGSGGPTPPTVNVPDGLPPPSHGAPVSTSSSGSPAAGGETPVVGGVVAVSSSGSGGQQPRRRTPAHG